VTAVDIIATACQAIGYRREAIVRNYPFADVLDPAAETRTAAIAAFTQTPPSYRTAAFAAVPAEGREGVDLVQAFRALCAPLLFVVEGNDITVWQVRSTRPPRVLERLNVSELPALFERNRDTWQPDAIHRAKAVGAVEMECQLDFVDLGLLPAVEGEIHAKLDRLLVETLAAASEVPDSHSQDMRLLFRVVFRLLAAKVLQDRGHPYAKTWNSEDLPSVLHAIESYYFLATMRVAKRRSVSAAYKAAWDSLRNGISFSNISADDLAFVYENTLVTPEARKLFGTHSTPRQVAEYVVGRLELHRHSPESLKIYEPFSGAGVFLVSALRHLRDLLPIDWDDQERHDFLVHHLAGDEIDPFACEVTTLSLILADYPNHNGWRIGEADLFDADTLTERLGAHNVILCNPPFEAFNSKERRKYRLPEGVYSKPMKVLEATLAAHPLALGFVLPRPVILERQYAELRRKIEKLYGFVELVELPDKIFGASTIEAAALIAHSPRPPAPNTIALQSTEIADRDRNNFVKTGEVSVRRTDTRAVADTPSGDLWIPSLEPLWRHLREYPKLESRVVVHRGIEWNYPQNEAWSSTRRSGYRRGLHTARSARQFLVPARVWLDCRDDSLRGGAIRFDWKRPKLVANAGRLSRGPWRIAAALDNSGLICSQQFFGIWPNDSASESDLLNLTAVLNGPVANAFLAVHSPAKGIRISAVNNIPVPISIPHTLQTLVAEYMALLTGSDLMHASEERIVELLNHIDATILQAYDLPPRLERQLFDYFRDAARPVAHRWTHWDDSVPMPGLRLAERLFGHFSPRENWVTEVFRPLPEYEAVLLRELGE
jgi:hypothetical protein